MPTPSRRQGSGSTLALGDTGDHWLNPLSLHTKRLLLRDLEPRDGVALASYFSEESAQPYILRSQRTPEIVAAAAPHFGKFPPFEFRSHFPMAVEVKDGGALAGICTLVYAEPGSTYAQLGWHLSEAHSGKGYATESGQEALRLAFEQKSVRSVIADCFANNYRAQRVLSKLGMHQQRLSSIKRWWTSVAYGADEHIVRYAIDVTTWNAQNEANRSRGVAQL